MNFEPGTVGKLLGAVGNYFPLLFLLLVKILRLGLGKG
jgi:hypothetical protein